MFELGFWTETPVAGPRIQSEVAVAVYAAFREAGIKIPQPQRVVQVEQPDGINFRSSDRLR
jgi:small-conductance mechanosensitive channel